MEKELTDAEKKREQQAAIARGVREVLAPQTIGWVRLVDNYLVKKDGGQMNLHFRSDHPSGEGHFFIPAAHFAALASSFQLLAELFEKRAKETNKLEKPGKV